VPQLPNIVFVLMDDMGYGDVGCYGGTVIRTPVMDSIAARGVRFTQMYAAAPICSPSRAAFLTGMYPQRVGIPRVLFPDDTVGITRDFRTVATILREQGYATQCAGKWHVGCLPQHNPVHHGFDEFYGLLYSNDMEPLHLYQNEEVIETDVDQAALTGNYTAAVVDFIGRNKDRPFFCYLAHTMPHIPLHVPPEFRGRSAAGMYGDTIECIDHNLGDLLRALRQNGLEERTLLIVTSDNGPWYEGSTGGLRGRKFDVYEGGVRMPFVAQWPGVIPAGAVCDEIASFMDLLPTFARLAGGQEAQHPNVDGKDIWPLFRGEGASPHQELYFYYHDSLNAVRAGKWKLHAGAGTGARRVTKEMPQLFDMERDPGESYNLADRHPEVVSHLQDQMATFDRTLQPIPNAIRPSRPPQELQRPATA
jgi:arylsulfatase A-like enzyme